jgi:hypothetical protein
VLIPKAWSLLLVRLLLVLCSSPFLSAFCSSLFFDPPIAFLFAAYRSLFVLCVRILSSDVFAPCTTLLFGFHAVRFCININIFSLPLCLLFFLSRAFPLCVALLLASSDGCFSPFTLLLDSGLLFC